MAADTGACYGGAKVSGAVKMAKGPDGFVFGIAGNAALGTAFLDWVRSGYIGESPLIPLDKDGDNEIVVLRAGSDGSLSLLSHFGAEDLSGLPYMAIGADAAVALGAMHVGAPAIRAISAAIEHGRWTSGKVFELPVGKSIDA